VLAREAALVLLELLTQVVVAVAVLEAAKAAVLVDLA
jgi:hypothetical protein